MKARVKATGEIVEVIPYDGFDEYDFYEPETKLPWLKSQLVFDVTDKDAIYNKGWQYGWDEAVKSEITKIHPRLKGSDPDYWTRLEHQAAIAAMGGMCGNPSYDETTWEDMAEDAIRAAHDLVQKMREERK